MVAMPALGAEVYRCGEPKGATMWSAQGHKVTDDGFTGVKPVVIVEGKEMRVVWGDTKAGSGEEKVWKAAVIHDSPDTISAIALDSSTAGSAAWLLKHTDSHAIQDSHKMAAMFEKHTGLAAPWPSHTHSDTVQWIKARGKGGTLADSEVSLCYGYEMAEACAEKWGKNFRSWQTGLGFRFRTALGALQAAGA